MSKIIWRVKYEIRWRLVYWRLKLTGTQVNCHLPMKTDRS